MKNTYYLFQVDKSGYYRPGTGEWFTNKKDALKQCRLCNRYQGGGYMVTTSRPSFDKPVNPETIIKK